MEQRTITDGHGVDVLTRRWPAPTGTAPKGVVLVAHGASEHSGRYDRFARALNEAGYSVAALDHRGHGGTSLEPDRATMGPGGGQAVLDDLDLLRSEAEAADPGVPTFLFGHSMGSMIALAYLTSRGDGLAGGILCGFPIDFAATGDLGALLRGAAEAGMRDEPFDALSSNNEPFEPARTPYDWLSRDPDEVDAYLADPLCGGHHPLTVGYLLDLFDVVAPSAERLGDIPCPTYVIAGDRDPAAGMGEHPTKLADALRNAGVAADLRLYEGARHELLNETNRDEVTADIVSWLDARVATT